MSEPTDVRFAEFILQQLAASEDWMRSSADKAAPERRAHLVAAVEHVRLAGHRVASAYGVTLRRPHVYLDDDRRVCFLCRGLATEVGGTDCPMLQERK